MTTDRAFCASLGHLPRNILRPHPTLPDTMFEGCLCCGAVLLRWKDGTEKTSSRLAYIGGRVERVG